jgi:hypothetical protein
VHAIQRQARHRHAERDARGGPHRGCCAGRV